MRKLFEREHDMWHSLFALAFVLLVFILTLILKFQDRIPKTISLFDFMVLSLATFRLIRLFTYDSITHFIREYFGQYSKGAKMVIHDLLDCPWCSGIWAAYVVSFVYFVFPQLWIFLLILALAGIGSMTQIIIWKIGWEPENHK